MNIQDLGVYISGSGRLDAYQFRIDQGLSKMGLYAAFPPLGLSVQAQRCAVLWLAILIASGAAILRDVNIVNGLASPNMTHMQNAFNLSSPSKDNHSILADPKCHCTSSYDWVPDERGFVITDCFNARAQFWKEKVKTHPENPRLEFLGYKAIPVTQRERAQTPMRWSVGE